MKGQYLAVEYVLFFAIGIVMVLGVYVTFSGINDNVREDSATIQLQKTGELIRGAIVNVYQTGKETDSTITYKLKIPARLSGHSYAIRYTDNLNINSTQNYKIGDTLSLYNININSPNIIYSTNGIINIKYDSGVVWLL